MQKICIEVSDMGPISKAFVAAHGKSQHTLRPDSLQEFSIVCSRVEVI